MSLAINHCHFILPGSRQRRRHRHDARRHQRHRLPRLPRDRREEEGLLHGHHFRCPQVGSTKIAVPNNMPRKDQEEKEKEKEKENEQGPVRANKCASLD